MLKKMKNLISKVRLISSIDTRLGQIEKELEDLKILCGSIHSQVNNGPVGPGLRKQEFKVFSQFGDDGIIQYLTTNIPILHKTFIEFGVEDFSESNCRFLMMKNNWEGFVIDGSEENIKRLKENAVVWKYNLMAEHSFISKENINELLDKSKFDYDVGIMSIDLDGVDYWIWKEIKDYRPRILIIEYNAVFGSTNQWTVPYQSVFQRTNAHYSRLYSGASLPALYELGMKKGYEFIGTNSAGNNAYFVRRDINTVAPSGIADAFNDSKFRESRDEYGNLTFVSGDDRLALIKGMPVYNTRTNQIETIT